MNTEGSESSHQPGVLRPFRVELVMRYTRISCMPFRATYPATRVVQARDEEDVVRQACLCLDRDLEQILARVNAINVSEVRVEVSSIQPLAQGNEAFWNPKWFSADDTIPPYVIVR